MSEKTVHPFGRKALEVALIDPDRCTGCGYCAMFCIMHCIEVQPDGLYKVTEECIGCRSCRVNCFSDAITMIRPQSEEA